MRLLFSAARRIMRRIAPFAVLFRLVPASLAAAALVAVGTLLPAADAPATKSKAPAKPAAAARPAAVSKLDHPDDRVAPWRKKVTIKLVGPARPRHTSHAYYVCNPE